MVLSGELKTVIIFRSPTVTRNSEGGREITLVDEITTRGKVEQTNMFRAFQTNATALLNTDTVWVRYSEANSVITKDWLLYYRGKDHVIQSIEMEGLEKRQWIKMIVKATETATATTPGTGGSGGGGGDPTGIDLSNLEITFVVTGADMEVALAGEKNADNNASRVDWGDGTVDDTAVSATISATHIYSPGTYTAMLYPYAGITNPEATAVYLLKTLNIIMGGLTGGTVAVTIGDSFPFCLNMIWFQAEDFGIADFPRLPDGSMDKMRNVNLKDNDLDGNTISQILIDLDAIGWPVGYVDVSGNPGAGSLTGAGTTAKNSLIAKGWTVIT